MDARDLLAGWPSLAKADARDLFASPAWRMAVDFNGGEGTLICAEPSESELRLDVALDDEPRVLGLSDSEAYPDLHRLWPRLAELPKVVVIALVEKEVGPLLQTIENQFRKELRIVGVSAFAQSGAEDGRTSFRLEAGGASFGFSLPLKPDTVRLFGTLDNVDPAHDFIRSLTRTARALYATVGVADEEAAALAPGDFLLADVASPSWIVELPEGGDLCVCSADEQTFSFAQFADDSLPAVPPPAAMTVFRRGRAIATAETSSVGDAQALKILSLSATH